MTENLKSLDPTPVIEAALDELKSEAALRELTEMCRNRLITDGIIGAVHNNDFVGATKRTIETVVRGAVEGLSTTGIRVVTQAIYEISQIEEQHIQADDAEIRRLMGDDTVFTQAPGLASTRASAI